jgi:hypothetical protein
MRGRVIELALFAVAAGIAWWLADAATSAHLARIARLDLAGPSEEAVRALARQAAMYFTAGIAVLAAARALGPGARVLFRRPATEPITVPWLIPCVVIASLFGLAIHLATVEVSRGVAIVPTAAPFAQGFLIGCIAAAVILLAPLDLAELATKA